MKYIRLNLRNRPFQAIINGQKRIEIRPNKNKGRVNYSNLANGDIIVFKNEKTKREISCIVKRKSLYKSIYELLISEGTHRTLSSTNSIEIGIRSVESIENYKEIISKHGVYAIEIELLELPPIKNIVHLADSAKHEIDSNK